MIPIRLSKDAASYIRKKTEYLRSRSPMAARNFTVAIKNASACCRAFLNPETHARLQLAGHRTLVAGDYLLDYSFDGSRIDITLVRRGRMVMPTPDIDIDVGQADDFGALADDTGQTP